MRGCAGKDDRKACEDAQGLAGKVQTSGNQFPQFAGLSCKDTGALPWRDAKDFKIQNSSSGQSFKRLWKANKNLRFILWISDTNEIASQIGCTSTNMKTK
jgi:hypothetical protein